jgi:hypothetical protein
MPKHRKDARLNSRVPVSTAGNPSPELASHPGPVGLNKHHEARLITSLVEYYGWTLCADGNLYNPYPGMAQGEKDAA